MTSGLKRTREEIEKIVRDAGYIFIAEYNQKNIRRVIFKDETGYKYEINLNSIINGFEPEMFRRTNPFTLENISLWLKINNKKIKLINDNVYFNNSRKLNFYCVRCKEVFKAGWNQIRQGTGCAVCSGNQVGKYNNLEYMNPELSKEWSFKNDVSPKHVTVSSSLKVLWECSVCGYEWYARVADRSDGKNCAACAGQVLTDKNRLSITHPLISNEWHPTLNGDLNPCDVSYGVNKKIWWKCQRCESEWCTSVNNRTRANSG